MQIRELPFTELLSHIADNRGRTCPTAVSGRPLIATNCITNDRLYPCYDTERFVSDETYLTWFRAHPLPGDIIFVCKGSPGRVALAPDPVDFCIAQDMVAVRADAKKVYPRYLFAVLRSQVVQDRIGNMHVGTLIPHFKKGDFDKLDIPVPDRQEQEFIGDTYFELSAKIEQNRRTGRALEGLAWATFKAWFVDFEPVKAKAVGQTSFPSMPPETFAALPDHLADSPLGPVPQGWAVRPIGELVTVKGGGTPSTKVAEYWDGGKHFWATPKDFSGLQEPVLLGTARLITDAGAECISSGVLPENTVLLSSRAPVGYTALSKVPVAVNQGFIAMTCDGPLPAHYVLHWTRSALEEIKSRASGTTFPEISKTAFRPIPALVPTPVVVTEFERFAQSLFDLIELNARQSRQLGELRDYLLPRLLSGSVRVHL